MLIRLATPDDAAAMTLILNRIIAIGGTTAHRHPLTVGYVLSHYITGSEVYSSVVADMAGQVLGMQSVELWQGDPHIGSFVDPDVQARGIGTAMFALTCQILRAAGIGYTVAAIRADNVPGLASYARMGFADISHHPDRCLKDGTPTGRISRRFDL